MKIMGDSNNDMWAEFRKAKGKEEKKKILDKMLSNHQEPAKSDANLTPNQMEIQKQRDKLYSESIASKVARGEYVSDADMKYLEQNDSELLSKSKFMNTERKRIENQVKNAKTKGEAQSILLAARQGALSLAMAGKSKTDEGGAIGMTFVSAVNKAEENTIADVRKKDRLEKEQGLEKSKLKRKINKLV